jgi:methionine synthase II (cobalamin-independent)
MSAAPGLYLSSTGSYPRIGDSPELQFLRRTIAALDRGDRSTADLLDVQNDVTRFVIAEQVKAGLDLVTDGLIRWYDPISQRARSLLRYQHLFSPARLHRNAAQTRTSCRR